MGDDGHSISRRGFLGFGAAAIAGSHTVVHAGSAYRRIAELLAGAEPCGSTRLRSASTTEAATSTLPREQYRLLGTATVTDNGVVVDVPPLHHEIVTARLAVERTTPSLASGRRALEGSLRELEASGVLDFTPGGLGLSVSWGLRYFTTGPIAPLWEQHGPVDTRASALLGTQVPALLDSVRFTTDPATMLLEDNDVCVVMASDTLSHLHEAYEQLFTGRTGELFEVTSRRMGFVDGSRLGTTEQSLTKRFALANHLPAASLIPDQAEMFLGFTSTQRGALGQGRVANFETLGFTDQSPTSYFAHGTVLSLSHVFEDLESWYSGAYERQVAAMFTPRIANPATTPRGTLTISESAGNIETEADVASDASKFGTVGHSSSMQPVSRLSEEVTDPYGSHYEAGTPITVREDFNTIDNPFAYSSSPTRDGMGSGPAAGLHFVIFGPSSYLFQQIRQAMDGEYADRAGLGAAAQQSAFMRVLQTTHRQNFLTPSRAHRSFPLAELL